MVEQREHPDKVAAFMQRIDSGEKIEAHDWMPDDYRKALIRLITMHGVSEIMGALPEKEWVPKAPTLKRKLAIMAKVQDEMGHGQLLLRVAEDLIAPLGRTRDDIFMDLLSGRQRFHNVFHMEAPTWADAGVVGWLVDGAAIITQTAMLDTSYGPYGRALARICAEEVFHARHGESMIMSLAEGTTAQRTMLQEAINRWWESLLMFFGPPERQVGVSHQDRNIRYKIRTKTNEQMRQKFFDKYVPRIFSLGFTVPDETMHYDQTEQRWIYKQPDWKRFKAIIDNNGPKSADRLQLRKVAYEENGWVREALFNVREAVS